MKIEITNDMQKQLDAFKALLNTADFKTASRNIYNIIRVICPKNAEDGKIEAGHLDEIMDAINKSNPDDLRDSIYHMTLRKDRLYVITLMFAQDYICNNKAGAYIPFQNLSLGEKRVPVKEIFCDRLDVFISLLNQSTYTYEQVKRFVDLVIISADIIKEQQGKSEPEKSNVSIQEDPTALPRSHFILHYIDRLSIGNKIGGAAALVIGVSLLTLTALANYGAVNFGLVEAIQKLAPASVSPVIEHAGTQFATVIIVTAVIALVAAFAAEKIAGSSKEI